MSLALRRTDSVDLVPWPPTEPGPGQVRVRVWVAGVCRTDVAVAEGRIVIPRPVVLGHEACGEVDAIGPGAPDTLLGHRVAVDPWFGDGQAGVAVDGAFASSWLVPAARCLRVPDHWSDARAAFLEPVAAALAPLSHLPPGARVAVGGRGRIAALTRRVLRAAGVDLRAEGPVDAAVETHPEAVRALVARLPRRGLLVLKSRPGRDVLLPWDAVVSRELRLQGAFYGPFDQAMALLDQLDVDDLFGETYPLSRWRDAFLAADAEHHKVFLDPSA